MYLQATKPDLDEAAKLLPKSIPDSGGNKGAVADTRFLKRGKTLEPSVLPRKSVTEAGLEPARPFRVSGF